MNHVVATLVGMLLALAPLDPPPEWHEAAREAAQAPRPTAPPSYATNFLEGDVAPRVGIREDLVTGVIVAIPLELSPTPALHRGASTSDILSEVIARYFPEQPEKALRVVMCESGGIVGINTGNGYYGMWQFDLDTWRGVGGTGAPSDASAEEQTMRARTLYDARGWQPWPVCGKR